MVRCTIHLHTVQLLQPVVIEVRWGGACLALRVAGELCRYQVHRCTMHNSKYCMAIRTVGITRCSRYSEQGRAALVVAAALLQLQCTVTRGLRPVHGFWLCGAAAAAAAVPLLSQWRAAAAAAAAAVIGAGAGRQAVSGAVAVLLQPPRAGHGIAREGK